MSFESFRSAAEIVLLAIVSAVVYGILHDLVTAHVCVQYFTVAHPRIIGSEEPVALALLWGVIATWWVGLILGVPLALMARLGKPPKLSARDLVPKIARLLVVMGTFALLAGSVAFGLHENGTIWFRGPLASEIPEVLHSRFFFNAYAHAASYIVGFIGGLVLILLTWKDRKKMAAISDSR